MGKVRKFFAAAGRWLTKKSHLALVIALVLVLGGGFLSSLIQTNFYKVSITTETIETEPVTSKGIALAEESGVSSWSTADIYRPKSASADEQVPLVFVMPGIQRTKETQSSFCIELVRRGYAVICIDPYGQGESSSSYETQSATQEGYGLFSWMDYVFENLDGEFDYVDAEKVGAMGHSAGGNACQKLAEREGQIAADLKTSSRLNSIYITGYIRDFTWKNTACNVGISYSQNDEGAFQNETASLKAEIEAKEESSRTAEEKWWLTVGNADLRYAAESVELVNYQLGRYDGSSVEEVEIEYDGETFSVEEVEIGKLYGNPYELDAVVINNETALHALQPYDPATIANMLDFFEITFDGENVLSSSNQIWWMKELGGLMALCGGFTFICALCIILLDTRAFASLRNPLPARTGNQKVKGRILFWVTFVIGAVLAFVLYMVCVNLSVEWFTAAASSSQTWFFPQRFTNAVMLWAVFNGLIGIALFFLTWGIEYLIDYLRVKRKGGKEAAAAEGAGADGMVTVQRGKALTDAADNLDKSSLPLDDGGGFRTTEDVHKHYRSRFEPLKLKKMDILKTLGLAAILIASFFALDYFIYLVFHADMRFMFISARISFNWRAILAMLMYVPIFFIFYFSNSFRVNLGMRPSNWKEWLSKLIAVLGNTLGLIAIVVVQYIPLLVSGQVYYTSLVGPQWLFVNLLFSIIPMMIALPLFNRFFFNRTGKVWLGPIVICFIFIIMTGGATTIYYAL